MQMEATLDTGPTFLVAREPIRPDDTVGSLEPRLAALGAPLLIETLDRLESKTITATPQGENGVTLAPPVTREMGFLDPTIEDAAALYRRLHGVTPRPGAYIQIGDRTVKVLTAQVEAGGTEVAPGAIAAIRKDGIVLATRGGLLVLTQVQPEGRGPMSAADFARGARLAV